MWGLGASVRRWVAAVLLPVGPLVIVVGFYLLNLCTLFFVALCVQHDYAALGILVAVLGFGVSAVDLFWLTSIWKFDSGYKMRVFCTECGQRLRWVQESDQWYCARCGQFRLVAGTSQPSKG